MNGVMHSCLLLIASWWYVRIGVLRSDCFELITYRSKEGIDEQEVLLLFNCSIVVGHYTPILRYDASVMSLSNLKKSDGYVWEVDLKEKRNRGDQFQWDEGSDEGTTFVVISKQRFMDLLEIERKYKNVCSVLGSDVKVVKKRGSQDPDMDPDVIQRTPQKMAKKRIMEPAPEVQGVKKGDLHWDPCDTMFPSTFALDRHVKKYHMDQYNYKCKECGKGFMNKESVNNHAKTHVQQDPKYPCDQCCKAINSRRALNTCTKGCSMEQRSSYPVISITENI